MDALEGGDQVIASLQFWTAGIAKVKVDPFGQACFGGVGAPSRFISVINTTIALFESRRACLRPTLRPTLHPGAQGVVERSQVRWGA